MKAKFHELFYHENMNFGNFELLLKINSSKFRANRAQNIFKSQIIFFNFRANKSTLNICVIFGAKIQIILNIAFLNFLRIFFSVNMKGVLM